MAKQLKSTLIKFVLIYDDIINYKSRDKQFKKGG